MNTEDARVKDPVCEMMVNPDDNAIVYLQMNFAFCSRQCKERFLANPHLYVGFPGHKAPKQEGRAVIKRRRVHLAESLSSNGVLIVKDELQTMMGIKEIQISENTIEITYDLLQVTLQQIENKLKEIGAGLGSGWSERLHRAFVHESEELEIDSLEVTPHR